MLLSPVVSADQTQKVKPAEVTGLSKPSRLRLPGTSFFILFGPLSRLMSGRTSNQQHRHSFHLTGFAAPCACTFRHLVPLYLTSFPLFFSASMRTSESLSVSIQTSFFGRSISNVSTGGTKNSCFTENSWCSFPSQHR